MTADEDSKPGGGAGSGRRRAAKPPVIDLKAETVDESPGTTPEEPPAAHKAADEDIAAEKAPESAAEAEKDGAETISGASGPTGAEDPAAGGEAERARPRRIAGFALPALVGGLVGGGLIYGAYLAGFLPGRTPDLSVLTVLQGRVERLEDRPVAEEVDLGPLQSRIAALESAEGEDGAAALEPRIATLEPRIATLERSVAALEERVAEPLPSTGDAVDLTPIEERLGMLEERIGALPAGGGEGEPASGAVEALRSELAATKAGLNEAMRALAGRTETLAAGIAGRETNGTERSGRIQAALALREAVGRGAVPAGLIAQARSLDLPTDALEAALADGAVSLDMLTAAFNDNAGHMLQAARPPASGVIGRIAEGARSLVTIRAAGPQSGDTPEAIISRIDAALRRGDTALAEAEFGKLPPQIRSASGPFGELLARRQAALAAADGLMQRAIGG